MRLTEFTPTWVAVAGSPGPQGVAFGCPHCTPGKRTELLVLFANPIGGGPRFDGFGGESAPAYHWQRTGETFDSLTLSPSVNFEHVGHWHGFITNGEVR